jgi:hypothetical protein
MAVVAVCDPEIVDASVLGAYLQGLSESEAATSLCMRLGLDAESGPLVLRVVADQYRTFALLEQAYSDPERLLEGGFPLLALDDPLAHVQDYYALNPDVTRALLGKMLTSRVRAGLDVVADKADIRPKEAWRNFDNLRRVFDALEDAEWHVPVCSTIQNRFCLPHELAWRYTCILFLFKQRLNLASDVKKTLAAVPSGPLLEIASAMLCCWTQGVVTDAPLSAPWVHLRNDYVPPRVLLSQADGAEALGTPSSVTPSDSAAATGAATLRRAPSDPGFAASILCSLRAATSPATEGASGAGPGTHAALIRERSSTGGTAWGHTIAPGAAPAPNGFALDLAGLVEPLRDFLGRAFKGRAERSDFAGVVVTSLLQAIKHSEVPVVALGAFLHAPEVADDGVSERGPGAALQRLQSDADPAVNLAVVASELDDTSRAEAEVARRVEGRAPGVLKALRDIAVSLSSVSYADGTDAGVEEGVCVAHSLRWSVKHLSCTSLPAAETSLRYASSRVVTRSATLSSSAYSPVLWPPSHPVPRPACLQPVEFRDIIDRIHGSVMRPLRDAGLSKLEMLMALSAVDAAVGQLSTPAATGSTFVATGLPSHSGAGGVVAALAGKATAAIAAPASLHALAWARFMAVIQVAAAALFEQ